MVFRLCTSKFIFKIDGYMQFRRRESLGEEKKDGNASETRFICAPFSSSPLSQFPRKYVDAIT